jgi:hypothetical protein
LYADITIELLLDKESDVRFCHNFLALYRDKKRYSIAPTSHSETDPRIKTLIVLRGDRISFLNLIFRATYAGAYEAYVHQAPTILLVLSACEKSWSAYPMLRLIKVHFPEWKIVNGKFPAQPLVVECGEVYGNKRKGVYSHVSN